MVNRMAKGLGEYSGVAYTPHGLSWLIRQRKRIAGQIRGIEKQLRELPARLESLPAQLRELQEQLAAVDMTISLHDIKVDPTTIRPGRVNEERLVPYGHLARTMLNHLRDSDGPQSTTELSIAVAKAHDIALNRTTQGQVRRTVITGLNSLRKRGLVTSVVIADANGEKAWSLTTRTESLPRDADPASSHATK
jgi:hypothetical protein